MCQTFICEVSGIIFLSCSEVVERIVINFSLFLRDLPQALLQWDLNLRCVIKTQKKHGPFYYGIRLENYMIHKDL